LVDNGYELSGGLKPLFLVKGSIGFVVLEAVGNNVSDVIKVVNELVTKFCVSEVCQGENVLDVEGRVVGHQVVVQHRNEDLGVKV